MKLRELLFSILFIAGFQSIFAQGISMQLSAKKIEVGEELVIVFEAKNIEVKDIKTPNFGAFQLLGGPQIGRSSNYSYVNGQMNRSNSTSFTYFFTSKKIGKQIFPKMSFVLTSGQVIESQPIEIEVVKAGSMPRQQQVQGNPFDPFYDPFAPFSNQGRAQKAPQSAPPGVYADASKIELKKDIFARIIVDKYKVYLGEQLTASVKIYTAVNSTGFEAEKVPNFNGFWSQDIKLPEKPEMKREIINGKEYVSVEIKKIVLFPTKTGTLEITPLNMKTIALVPVQSMPAQRNRRQPRDLFELMEMQMEEMMRGTFNSIEYKQIPYNLTSGSVKIQVLPLPDNAPKSFGGAVGNFTMNAYTNKKNLKTDETLEYKIEVQGKGNLPLIENPKMEWDEDFEVFEPTLKENYNPLPVYNGSKTWNFVAIPHNPGKYKTPPIEFTYFDLTKKAYVTLKADPTELEITGSPTKRKGNSKSFDGNNLAKQKIGNIETVSAITNYHAPLNMFWLWCLIPLFLVVIYEIYERLSSGASSRFADDKKIAAMLQKQMKLAKIELDKNDKIAFYNETTRCIWSYLANKLQMETSELNRENIQERLSLVGVSESSSQQLIAVLDSCEMGLYSSFGTENMKQRYEETLSILTNLEKEIGKTKK